METDHSSSEEQSSKPEQQVQLPVASHRSHSPAISLFHHALHPESIDTTTATTRTTVGNISECYSYVYAIAIAWIPHECMAAFAHRHTPTNTPRKSTPVTTQRRNY